MGGWGGRRDRPRVPAPQRRASFPPISPPSGGRGHLGRSVLTHKRRKTKNQRTRDSDAPEIAGIQLILHDALPHCL